MRVSILNENTVYKRGFLGEHGLSLLIETGEKRYLFDTGQSHVFLHNAGKMQVDLNDLDGIILSHGHYDHCGGMESWRKAQAAAGTSGSREIPIYISEKALEKKYTENPGNGKLRYIGVEENEEVWKDSPGSRKFVYTKESCSEIADGVYLLSNIPYVTEFEPVPKGFWKESLSGAGLELTADTMEDEQLLVIRSENGLCVFAGCAHPGMINCLRFVQSQFPGERIHSLVAGMHLKGCTSARLQATIQAIKELEMDVLVPLHCTGITAIAAMKEALKDRCMLAEAGKKITL